MGAIETGSAITTTNAEERGWGQGWPHCQLHNIVTITPLPGVPFEVHHAIAPLVEYLAKETERRGYHLVPGWCWSFACRAINGTGTASNHSWGLAVDINAPKNPQSHTFISDMPRWVPELWKAWGFGWGGDYRPPTKFDPMHMEFLGTPADAARFVAILTSSSEDFLPMLTDAEQHELLSKVRTIYADTAATEARSNEQSRILAGAHRTNDNPNGDAKGTMLGRLRDDSARHSSWLKMIAVKLGIDLTP